LGHLRLRHSDVLCPAPRAQQVELRLYLQYLRFGALHVRLGLEQLRALCLHTGRRLQLLRLGCLYVRLRGGHLCRGRLHLGLRLRQLGLCYLHVLCTWPGLQFLKLQGGNHDARLGRGHAGLSCLALRRAAARPAQGIALSLQAPQLVLFHLDLLLRDLQL